MSGKRYFSYVRVSTAKQGQNGTSLTEQRSAIERYAKTWGLTVTREYEERETAAKHGRPVFLDMIKALRRAKAEGVIMHKIDRSARNLKDWAELGGLIDRGVEVHFANESLDLKSRGGRLSADIQAVVASDYIRNLREETKKGIYGRLKQGLFPFRAVVGYLDAGGGKPKEPDPVQAPLIRQLFELYSTGTWGLNGLVDEMYRLGLRSRNGRKITRNGLATILHNPFYMGVIRIGKTGELYQGVHEPIVSKQLFDHVQTILDDKNIKKKRRHFFVFSRHTLCAGCQNKLVAERQKGNVYYRCQKPSCRQKTVREEVLEERLTAVLAKLKFNEAENAFFKQEAQMLSFQMRDLADNQKRELEHRLDQMRHKLSKVADAYVDGVFDEETYKLKRNDLILEEKEIKEKLNSISIDPGRSARLLGEFLELANSAYASYKKANSVEKRELVKTITSNFTVDGKSVSIKLNLPFQIVHERESVPIGSPYGASTRTFRELFKKLFDYFTIQANSKDTSENNKH